MWRVPSGSACKLTVSPHSGLGPQGKLHLLPQEGRDPRTNRHPSVSAGLSGPNVGSKWEGEAPPASGEALRTPQAWVGEGPGPLPVRLGLSFPIGWHPTSLSHAVSTVCRVTLQASPGKPCRPSVSSERKVRIHTGGTCPQPPTRLGQAHFSQNLSLRELRAGKREGPWGRSAGWQGCPRDAHSAPPGASRPHRGREGEAPARVPGDSAAQRSQG